MTGAEPVATSLPEQSPLDLLLQLRACLDDLAGSGDAFDRIARAAQAASGAQAVVLATVRGGQLQAFHAVGYPADALAGADATLADATMPLGRTIERGEPLLIPSREALLARFPALPPERLQNHAWAILPLHWGGAVVGAVSLGYAQAREFTQEDLPLLDALALACSEALSRVELHERSWMAVEDLRRSEAETRRLNDDLQRRSEEFQALLDVLPCGIAVAHDAKCETITCNRWLSDLLGVPEGANISRSLAEARLPYRILREGREVLAVDLPMQTCARTGKPVRGVECDVVRDDGRVVHLLVSATPLFDPQGSVRGCVATFTDITTRKLSDAQLRESEARFQLVARATSEVLWDWDLESDEIWWSPNMEVIFGHTDRERGSTSWWRDALHDEDRARVLAGLDAALESGATRWQDEYRFQRGDGGFSHVLDRGQVVRDEKGRATRVVGSMVDISDRIRLEREAALQREALARQERLSALGTLVSGVAHEVRTPLAYINNHAHMIRMRVERARSDGHVELAERLGSAADAIVEGVERIDRLVLDLRRFLKPEPSERARTDVDAALRDAARIFEATHRGGVRLETRFAAGAALDLDKVELQQIALNLLENAADASGSGSTVRIRTERAGPRGVRILVEDEGAGIPEPVRLRMFDPFFTTKSEGTGLGLSIVRRIVETHGGSIACESAPGRGTTFRIELPVAT